MAKIEFKGLEAYSAKLDRLSALSQDKIIGAAVYDGAAVVADAVKAEIQALPVDDSHKKKARAEGPSSEAKQALLENMGISPMRDDSGFINVKLGFDGYAGAPTPSYPRGKPVPMLARAVQSGTSFMVGHAFVKNGVRKSRKAAVAAMGKRVAQEIEQTMN